MKPVVRIKPVDLKPLNKKLDQISKRYFDLCIAEYTRLARRCVTDARNKSKAQGGFDDQTGNLRASMGYVIFYNGKLVDQNFEGISKGKGIGSSLAKKIGSEYPKNWAIVIVAGMEYASYVEAKSYDVITGSTLGMTAKFNEANKRILSNLKNEFGK